MRFDFLLNKHGSTVFAPSAALVLALSALTTSCALDRGPNARVFINLERGSGTAPHKVSDGPVMHYPTADTSGPVANEGPATVSGSLTSSDPAPSSISDFDCFGVRAAWEGAPLDPRFQCKSGQTQKHGIHFGSVSGEIGQTSLEFLLPQGPKRHLELIGLQITGTGEQALLANGCPSVEKLAAEKREDSSVSIHAWKIGHAPVDLFGPASVALSPWDNTQWVEYDPCEGGSMSGEGTGTGTGTGTGVGTLSYANPSGLSQKMFSLVIPSGGTASINLSPTISSSATSGTLTYEVVGYFQFIRDAGTGTTTEHLQCGSGLGTATQECNTANFINFGAFNAGTGEVTFTVEVGAVSKAHKLVIKAQARASDGSIAGSKTELWLAAAAPSQKRVFATSTFHPTSEIKRVDGVLGADRVCNQRAFAAGLFGTRWKAWLSDSTEYAIDRIGTASPWILVGTSISSPVFLGVPQITSSGPTIPINQDEFGTTIQGPAGVWTGTDSNGQLRSGYNCSNWTDSTNSMALGGGLLSSTGAGWTTDNTWECNSSLRLYCFEQ